MLTWAWVYLMIKTGGHSQLGHIIPILADVAIVYLIACAISGHKL